MPALHQTVRNLVGQDRYLIGLHAAERLQERGIMEWQVVAGVSTAKLLVERPNNRPNPVVEFDQLLSDGTSIKAVWSWLKVTDYAKLVTVHFHDR